MITFDCRDRCVWKDYQLNIILNVIFDYEKTFILYEYSVKLKFSKTQHFKFKYFISYIYKKKKKNKLKLVIYHICLTSFSFSLYTEDIIILSLNGRYHFCSAPFSTIRIYICCCMPRNNECECCLLLTSGRITTVKKRRNRITHRVTENYVNAWRRTIDAKFCSGKIFYILT